MTHSWISLKCCTLQAAHGCSARRLVARRVLAPIAGTAAQTLSARGVGPAWGAATGQAATGARGRHQPFSIARFVYCQSKLSGQGPAQSTKWRHVVSPGKSQIFASVMGKSYSISASATQRELTVGLCPNARVRHFCLWGKCKAAPDDRAAPRPIGVGCQA
jgi:hypothetical protein